MQATPAISAGLPLQGGPRSRFRAPSTETVLFAVVLTVVLYLVLAPAVFLLWSSVRDTATRLPFEAGVPYSLVNYIDIYADPSTYPVLWNTLLFTLGSVALGLPISFAFAWLVERTNMPGRNVAFGLIVAPLALPGMLTAMGWVLLTSSNSGLINIILRSVFHLKGSGPLDVYNIWGMIFVQALTMVPGSFLLLLAAVRTMDPSHEEAALASGAPRWQVLRRVTVPMLAPALLAVVIYEGIAAMEAFEVPGVIGLNGGIFVLGTQIYEATHGSAGLANYGQASALAVLLVALALVLLRYYRRFTNDAERYNTVSGKAYRQRQVELGAWRFAALAGVLIYLLLAAVLPFFILVWGSLLPFYQPPAADLLPKLSLDGYNRILHNPIALGAFSNTVIMVAVTTVAILLITSLAAWLIVRSRIKGRGLLDVLTFLPHTLPSIVIGLAVMLVYLFLPIPIYGTIWIIVVGVATKHLAFPSRTLIAAQVQIHGELEEAAQVSGASPLLCFRKVVMPLMMPALVNTGVWVLMGSMRELSIALMLYNQRTAVLSTLIWNEWANGRVNDASAYGVVLALMVVALSFAGRSLLIRPVQQ